MNRYPWHYIVTLYIQVMNANLQKHFFNIQRENIQELIDTCKTTVIGLVSLFNGISTFAGYFNAKAILLEEQ